MPRPHRIFRLLAGLAGLLAATAGHAELPRIDLNAGFYRIEAEVAATPAEREVGLMNRSSMPAGHGMLFVFPVSAGHCFWMKNTLIPLSIAFIDERGKIVSIDEMAPQTENSHCPAAPVRYALEMNSGWFKAKGLKPGLVIGGLERAPAGR